MGRLCAVAGYAPPHQHHLGARVRVADDRGRIVGKHARHRREIADIAVDHPKQVDDGGLVGGDAVAHRPAFSGPPSLRSSASGRREPWASWKVSTDYLILVT